MLVGVLEGAISPSSGHANTFESMRNLQKECCMIFGIVLGGGEPTAMLDTVSSIFIFLLIPIIFIVYGFLLPALHVNYIRHGTFRSCFQLRHLKSIIVKHWKSLLLIALSTMGISAILNVAILTAMINITTQIVLTFVLGLTYAPWMRFVSGHLYGQVATMVDLDKLAAADQ